MPCSAFKASDKARFAILLPTNEWEPIVQLALTNGSTILNPAGTRGAFEEPPFARCLRFLPGHVPPRIRAGHRQHPDRQPLSAVRAGRFRHVHQRAVECRRVPPAPSSGDGGEVVDHAAAGARCAAWSDGVSMAGGSSFVIFKSSKNKEAAMKLIEYLSQPAVQVRFYEVTGDLPARRAAWRSPLLANDPLFPAFREQLERVAPLPQVPEWEEIATTIYEHGEAAVRGKFTEAQALADLDRTTDRILEKRRWILAHAPMKIRDPRRSSSFSRPRLTLIAVFFFLPVHRRVRAQRHRLRHLLARQLPQHPIHRPSRITGSCFTTPRSGRRCCNTLYFSRGGRAAHRGRLARRGAARQRQAGALQADLPHHLLRSGRDDAGRRGGGVAVPLPSAFRHDQPRAAAARAARPSTGSAIRSTPCRPSSCWPCGRTSATT